MKANLPKSDGNESNLNPFSPSCSVAMAGKKSRGGGGSGSAQHAWRQRVQNKSNPFERRFGKEKHAVLNRKSKTDEVAKGKKRLAFGKGGAAVAVGKPGLSRSKAIQKRKDTLLKEYKMKDKANVFLDRRIGEGDNTVSVEEKMLAR